jgi:hypothetical protein
MLLFQATGKLNSTLYKLVQPPTVSLPLLGRIEHPVSVDKLGASWLTFMTKYCVTYPPPLTATASHRRKWWE